MVATKTWQKKTEFDKVLRDKAFKIDSNAEYNGYERRLIQWFTIFLIKNLLVVMLNLH